MQDKNNMKRKNKILIVFTIFGVFLLIFLGVIIIKKQKQTIENVFVASKSQEESAIKNSSSKNDNILVQSASSVRRISVSSGLITPAGAEDQGDFSGFVGMIKPDVSKKEVANDNISLISKDKNEIIVNHTIGIENTLAETEEGLLNAKSEDYICDVQKKKCEKTSILTDSYQGLDIDNDNGAVVWWTNWDTKNNLIFGHLSSENSETSPVFICNTLSKICKKNGNSDISIVGDERANIPRGFVSTTLDKFVMVKQNDIPEEQTGIKWDLLLYASDDLSKPLKTLDISAAIDQDESIAYDSVHSVAWSSDEKKIAIATSNRIYLLDLESGMLNLLYMTPLTDEGDVYLDNNVLIMTNDDKYVAFVENTDLINTFPEQALNENGENAVTEGVLKKIDLENHNIVTDIIKEQELQISQL